MLHLADIVETGEQMWVQHILAEGAVQAFNVDIVVWLVGLDVVDH